MHQKAPLRATSTPPRAISATALPRSQLARLAARLPQPTTPVRTAAIRPVAAKAVGSYVPRITRPAFEKFGFSAVALVTDWAAIVGADIASYTVPERLKWPRRAAAQAVDAEGEAPALPGATLVLAVANGRALDIQYKSRQLLERVNAYLGYAAIAELRIVQIAAMPGAAEPPESPLRPGQKAAVERSTPAAELSGVADQGLRAALERMAAGLVSRKGPVRGHA